MARQYRQNVKYNEIVSDSEGDAPEQEQGNRGNTGLPFGLCKKYGISLPANATPRDAWTALKNKTGLSPQDFYDKLKGDGKERDGREQGGKEPSTPKFQIVREAQDYAERTFGVTCDYSGISVEVANEMNAAIERGRQLCPAIMDGIKFIGSAQKRNAAFRKELTEYFYQEYKKNTPYYSDAELRRAAESRARDCVGKVKSSTASFASRYTGDPNSPFGKIATKYTGIFINDKFGRDAQYFSGVIKFDEATGYTPVGCNSILAVFDHEVGHQIDYAIDLRNDVELASFYRGMSRGEVGQGLSKYGSTSIAEFIAEAYAEYRNNPNARPIAKKVYEIIQRRLKI